MTIPEAKPYIGKNCWIKWTDRCGNQFSRIMHVENIQYQPLYGSYLIGDAEEVRLDRVTEIRDLG